MAEQLSLGEKIKNFRKRAGISQMELETAIGAANGSVSRIESNQVDPSKETLLKISRALDLVPIERSYLLDVFYAEPNEAEIANAIAEVQPILKNKLEYAYLLDQHSCILEISSGFKLLARTAFISVDQLKGKNVAEILFDPTLKIRQFIDKDKFKETVRGVLGVLNQERGHLFKEPWWQELIARLNKFPDFKELWAEAQAQNFNLYDYPNRTVHFKLFGKEMPMVYNFMPLNPDSRFVLVEYQLLKK